MSPARLASTKVALLLVLCIWLAGLVFFWNNPRSIFRQHQAPQHPFGFMAMPGGGINVQDLAYNLVFFRGIRDQVVPHPYRLDDQEKLVRLRVPGISGGMSHAYSPVAFVLALPFLRISGENANLLYDLVGTAGLLGLFYFCLLPCVVHPVQLIALGLVVMSVCLLLTVGLGQSSLITTPLLGFFWMLLRARNGQPSLPCDALLALLFWAICLKPSVALIPLALLLGERAWRPLLIAFGLLALTWAWTAPFYGGTIQGLRDYSYLLNHYNDADFTPFMRRSPVAGQEAGIRGLFAFDRVMAAALTIALVILRGTGRIGLSGLLQGLIASFLLFSPYLLPSEDLILCLLVAESTFFCEVRPLLATGKLLLVFAIMNLRSGMNVSWDFHFELKCLLFGWMAFEALLQQRRERSDSAHASIATDSSAPI